jgi:hypothetical protein
MYILVSTGQVPMKAEVLYHMSVNVSGCPVDQK